MKKIAAIAMLALAGTASAQSFNEGFETGLPATPAANGAPGTTYNLASGNWVALNQSVPLGTTGVFAGNTTVFPAQAGTAGSYAAMNFNSGAGTATIATYFFSPVVTFNNGDTISFWSRTTAVPAFPDRLRLRLSTAGASTNPADFSTVLVTINPNLTTTGYPNAWTQYSATVSGLSGASSGRFAFHYDVPNGGPSGVNSDFIGIDTVAYSAVPAPSALALLGLGGLVATRRRR